MPNSTDSIDLKKFLKKLDFVPKDNSLGIFFKRYFQHNDYIVTIDFEKKLIDFGNKIKCESKTTQNFSQPENFVVLECVDRLLSKGYKPEDLILEKTWKTGHGTSGRLDILVLKEKKAFLMIECKTFGKEYEKELNNINKNGGQLFTYFQQDTNAKYLMLYASKFEKDNIIYLNDIINIEDSYRETTNVKDFYDRWNKITKQNGIFENWVNVYNFESKSLTLNQLKPITEKDASKIFNRFLEILRHNVVSDKPNAFNKIFTLFLCKIIDEQGRNLNDELEFQWIEGKDNNISFQKRLTDLYKRGMSELLSKEVTDLSDKEFNKKFGNLKEEIRNQILEEITKLRLQKNNEFAIKEVFDNETFEENSKVLKEVVELLQIYQFRYNKKQQYLSNFFELLLTTGLKQESGQFFTPIPVARFICKSIPMDKLIMKKLNKGDFNDLLPNVIDYATGSGHFLIESMDEIQQIIDRVDESKFNEKLKKKISSWKLDQFDWANEYIYGIEQDYRLVKTAKVGCYLNGDGIANVIIGDGLDNFEKSKSYRGKLKKVDNDFKQDNKQFDIIISNPPYSVSAFKGNLKNSDLAEKDFDLYKNLTDQSSEIECLFVERTKQLLKEGGIAGIILPSSILSNTGIYTKTREILLKYFEIISITALGSGTFMATGTNTVTLFLRRRNDYDWKNIEASIESFTENLKDVSLNGIENIFSKYVINTFENISFSDYISIFKKSPNKNILDNEIFKDYKKGIKAKDENDLLNKIIEIEKEKLLYFILAFNQKVILVKSGEKKVEKEFLGYEFSNRRGSEGIHPIQRGKLIDDCTKLFDSNSYDNEEKVSTYIYDAFEGNFDRKISENLKEHICRINLIDMMTFNRLDFEKNISLNSKQKIEIESKWDLVKLGDIIFENQKSKIKVGDAKDDLTKNYIFFTSGEKTFTYKSYLVDGKNIFLSTGGNAIINFHYGKASYSTDTYVIKSKLENIKTKYLYYILKSQIKHINIFYFKGQGLKHLQKNDFRNIEVPLPSKEIQKKIIEEIEVLEKLQEKNQNKIEEFKNEIKNISNNLDNLKNDNIYIGDKKYFKDVFAGGDKPESYSLKKTSENIYPIYANAIKENGLYGFTNIFRVEQPCVTISARGTIGFPIARKEKFYPIVRLIVIIPNENINFKYLKYILKKSDIQKAGTNIPQLTVPMVKNIKIPLPPIKEQNKIVEKIEKIEKEISKLEEEIKEIPNLKEKILKKYL